MICTYRSQLQGNESAVNTRDVVCLRIAPVRYRIPWRMLQLTALERMVMEGCRMWHVYQPPTLSPLVRLRFPRAKTKRRIFIRDVGTRLYLSYTLYVPAACYVASFARRSHREKSASKAACNLQSQFSISTRTGFPIRLRGVAGAAASLLGVKPSLSFAVTLLLFLLSCCKSRRRYEIVNHATAIMSWLLFTHLLFYPNR